MTQTGSRRAAYGAVLLALTLTACGSGAPAPRFGVDSSTQAQTAPAQSGWSTQQISSLETAVAAPVVPSDIHVQIDPHLYADPGDPCAGIATAQFAAAPPACAQEWAPQRVQIIPGEDMVTGSPMPRSAAVDAQLGATRGTEAASAFFLTTAVRQWGLNSTELQLVHLLDTGLAAETDPIYQALSKKTPYFVDMPACSYPTSIRVSTVSATVNDYLTSAGWYSPGGLAVVATFPACRGTALFASRDDQIAGKATTILGHDHPVSILSTGTVQQVRPFGAEMFVITAWTACTNAPQLASLC